MKPRRLLPLVLAGLLAGPPGGLADTIAGYVLEAEADRRVAGVEVAFLVPGEGDGLVEMSRRATDDDGAFTFSGPFLSAGTRFALVAHYGNVEYATGALVVGEQDQVILEVYDGTEDDADVRFEAHHVFLSLSDAGLEVAQLIHVGNHGDRTYVGRMVGDERRVVDFALPAGNLSLQGHTGEISRAGANLIYDNRPLPPGSSQAAFTFRVPADAVGDAYEHETLYPTDRFEVFLQPTTIDLGTPFQDLGEISLHDQRYRHYRLESLNPGRRVSIELPVSRPVRWALKWAMLIIIPAVLIGAIALARPVAAAPQASADEALERRRRELLQELARLDRELAVAEATQVEALRRQRQATVTEAADVYRRLGRG